MRGDGYEEDDGLFWWYMAGGMALGLGVAAVAIYATGQGPAVRRLATSAMSHLPGHSERRLVGGTHTFDMTHGAFDGRPGATVVIPHGYDAGKPLDLAIYVHGFGGCVENAVRDADGPCHDGGGNHHASHLAKQLADANVNTILVLPEILREQRSGAPGRLRDHGGLAALLNELLGEHMSALLGGAKSLSDVRNISLSGHSGGYTAMAAIIRAGDIERQLKEVALFDALYGDAGTFQSWARAHHGPSHRLVDIYSSAGGTDNNSRALAASLEHSVPSDGFWMDDSVADVQADVLPRHGCVFKHTSLSHTDVSRVWPQRVWASSPAFERINA